MFANLSKYWHTNVLHCIVALIFQEASRLGLYIKNKDGGEYENWCWPGNKHSLGLSPKTWLGKTLCTR